MPGTVAFQGARGAFSYEACLALRPWNEPKGYETFAEAIAAVASGECECGLIPVENSVVNFTKIAQRLPVKIAVDPKEPLAGALRPGLSVEVKVDVRKDTGLGFADAAPAAELARRGVSR